MAAAARSKAYHAATKAAKLTSVPTEVVEDEAKTEAVDAGTRDTETLRQLARSIDDAYVGEDGEADVGLNEAYGSRLGAVRALGAAVVSRGEELAGLTADEAVASWKRRRDEAEENYENLYQAHRALKDRDLLDFDVWAAEHHPGVRWQDTYGTKSLNYMRTDYSSEECVAASRAVWAAGDHLRETGIRDASDPESRADLRKIADGCQQALAEVRALGGHLELHELSDTKAAKAVTEASSVYPADWVRASTEAGPLAAIETKERAFYRNSGGINSDRAVSKQEWYVHAPAGSVLKDTDDRTYLSVDRGVGADRSPDPSGDLWLVQVWDVKKVKNKPRGHDWENVRPGIWRRKPRGVIDGPGLTVSLPLEALPGRSWGFNTAAHELGHHMQRTVPELSAMEHDWLIDRTTVDGTRGELVPLYEGSDEMVRPGNFFLAYIGKEYEGRDTTEVTTSGIQCIFGGDYGGLIGLGLYKRDDDMRHFILGAMASAGTVQETTTAAVTRQDQLATAA